MGDITASGRSLFKQGDFTIELVGQPDTNGTYPPPHRGGVSRQRQPHRRSPHRGRRDHHRQPRLHAARRRLVAHHHHGHRAQPPGGTGLVLQDLSSNDGCFIFAFFKNGVNIVPGTPSRDYVERLDDVVASRFHVTEITAGNGLGQMHADRGRPAPTPSTSPATTSATSTSATSTPASPPTPTTPSTTLEGILIPSVTQFIRDNSATGGVSGWATVSFDNGAARTHGRFPRRGRDQRRLRRRLLPRRARLHPGRRGRHAQGRPLGPRQHGRRRPHDRQLEQLQPGHLGDPQRRPVRPRRLRGRGGVSPPSPGPRVGYIYLPYSTENLVAGQIAADGSVISGTKGLLHHPRDRRDLRVRHLQPHHPRR